MKILITSPYVNWPANFGGAVRTLNIASALAGLGHEIVLLTASPAGNHDDLGQNVNWRSFQSGSALSHFYNPSFKKAYQKALSENPDLIIAEFPYQSRMIMGDAHRTGIPVVYDAHNVEVDRFRMMGKPLISRVVRSVESYCCRNSKGVLVTSASDGLLMKKYYGVSSQLLPNGVDTDRFTSADPDGQLMVDLGLSENRVALFFGTLNYGPNVEGLAFLAERVWPRVIEAIPEARLLVVGRNPPDWLRNKNGVVVAGAVDDIVPYIRLANIVLAPIFSGGGTRLKIIEALACGQTVLSTPFGAEGLDLERGSALILADKEQYATTLIAQLLGQNNPGQNGESRRLALAYDWDSMVAGIDWEHLAAR